MRTLTHPSTLGNPSKFFIISSERERGTAPGTLLAGLNYSTSRATGSRRPKKGSRHSPWPQQATQAVLTLKAPLGHSGFPLTEGMPFTRVPLKQTGCNATSATLQQLVAAL